MVPWGWALGKSTAMARRSRRKREEMQRRLNRQDAGAPGLAAETPRGFLSMANMEFLGVSAPWRFNRFGISSRWFSFLGRLASTHAFLLSEVVWLSLMEQ
jgi:hypothetical protein